jgi:hypothetical protein
MSANRKKEACDGHTKTMRYCSTYAWTRPRSNERNPSPEAESGLTLLAAPLDGGVFD